MRANSTSNSRYLLLFIFILIALPSQAGFFSWLKTIFPKNAELVEKTTCLVSEYVQEEEQSQLQLSDHLSQQEVMKILSSIEEKKKFSKRRMEEVTVCRKITDCDRDAEQLTNGSSLVTCNGNSGVSDLDLGEVGALSNQVALNFQNLPIPQGATIVSATVQFTALTSTSGATNLTIQGEYADNPAAYTAGYDVVSRPLTTASVSWSVPAWTAESAGTNEETPDLTAVIQEIVNRPGFGVGNNIAFHITGTGSREAYSNDITLQKSPKLCIVYEEPPATPEPTCTECPTMTLVSMDGIPNYPKVDQLNLCADIDTIGLLLYNPGECALTDIELEIIFDQGLFYGGFILEDANSNLGATILSSDLSDLTKPKFTIDEIPLGETIILNIGVQANCEVNTKINADINYDANLTYTYSGASLGATCMKEQAEIGVFNSALKVPVINLLSVTPQQLNITNSNTEHCQSILISQDGIASSLEEFRFEVTGLDTSLYHITGLSVNNIQIPTTDYSYDVVTKKISTTINGNYFPPNTHTGANGDDKFDSDERLTVMVCYMVTECIDDTNFLEFEAFYGCDAQICGDISSKEGAVDYTPSNGAEALASNSSSTVGQVCGAPMMVNFDISASNIDPIDGLWENLVLRWEACDLGISRTSAIEVNGVTLTEGTHYEIVSNTVVLDFASWTSNLDGSGGLSDEDGDGLFDDLPGGEVISVNIVIDLSCPGDEIPCGLEGVSCNIAQVDVRGLRDCGQTFQSIADIDPDIGFTYGGGTTFSNDIIDVEASASLEFFATELYTTPIDTWGASANGFEFAYEFNSENIGSCQNGGDIWMEVSLVSEKAKYIRYLDNSATYQGASVTGVTWEYVTMINPDDGMLDTIGLNLTMLAGSANPTLSDIYFLNFEYLGHCDIPTDEFFNFRVIEQCDDCTPSCETVRGCDVIPIRVDWEGTNCVTCPIVASVDSIQRTSFGYADKAMTQQLTAAQVNPDDLNRFLPGDTMYYRIKWEFVGTNNQIAAINRVWGMQVMHWNPQNAAGIPLHSEQRWAGWYIQDQGTGPLTEIGIPTTMQQYPNDTRDNLTWPSIYLRNAGLNYDEDGNYNTDGTLDYICEEDEQNLDLIPDYKDYIWGDLGEQSNCCDNRDNWAGLQINWGINEPCSPGARAPGYNSSNDEDHFNTVYEDFITEVGLEQGDVIYFEFYVPIVHNPGYDISQLNGQSITNTSSIAPRIYGHGRSPDPENCSTVNGYDCSYPSSSYYTQLPNDVSMSNTVTIDGCDVDVEYTFTFPNQVVDGSGAQWYANEYRPFEFVEYIQANFPTNFVYTGGAELELHDGTIIPIPDSYINPNLGNLTCMDNPAIPGAQCCAAADSSQLAGMRWVTQNYINAQNFVYSSNDDLNGMADTTNYPGNNLPCYSGELYYHDKDDSGIFPVFMVGGAEDCNSFTIRYSLTPLCPEEVNNTDFSLQAQFSEIAVQQFTEDQFTLVNPRPWANCQLKHTSFANIWAQNPYGTDLQSDGTDWADCHVGHTALYRNYLGGIRPDPDVSTGATNPLRQTITDITSVNDFVDNSLSYPPLSSTVNQQLLADLAGQNEVNRYVLCASSTGGGETHTNVTTSIEIPNTIQLVDIQSLSGTGFTFAVAQTLPNSTIYSIQMADLIPGACDSIEITTELLFCPVGLDLETKICINSSSGCLAADKAATVLAVSNACDVVESCYEYIAEEADIQVEWDPNVAGPYSLCETIPMGIRIKNVKPATLVDLKQDFWLPPGLNFVSGSFQICYPGGPTNVGACQMSIPDPIANPAENSAFGTNYGYDDMSILNSFIHSNGLPGILTSQDSNRVQMMFEVETVCDDFISGTSLYYQATAADPCENRVQSMSVESNSILINGALPEDFAQFFITADPVQANCGVASTMNLTYINVSPFGESIESTACIELDAGVFSYSPGSIQWVSPLGHNPMITETVNGNTTKICFTIPDGIGPGEAFSMNLDFSVPSDVACGAQDLRVNVTSKIEDTVCQATGTSCIVNVLNTVNPVFQVDFLPPLGVENQKLTANCPNGDGTIDLCYTTDLSNTGTAYTDNVTISIIRDLNQNGIADEGIDPVIASDVQAISLNNGETININGCITINESVACPIIFRIEQVTSCQCDITDLAVSEIIPTVVETIPPVPVICPGETFTIEGCSDWQYAVEPNEGGILTTDVNGDVSLEVNTGYGIESPVKLVITSGIGGCNAVDTEFEVYSLAEFEFGPYENKSVCNQGCTILDLGLPSYIENAATILWSPSTNLDDPTSFSPQLCDPSASETYSVTLTFSAAGQSCILNTDFAVTVESPITENVIANGDLCPGATSVFTAPSGYSSYKWLLVNGDGTTTVVAFGGSNVLTPTVSGDYQVEYSNIGNVCPKSSNVFTVLECIDYGDLPDASAGTNANNYETSSANSGASHQITDGLSLGITVDEESDGQANVTATGDGVDEDGLGVTSNINMAPNGQIKLPFNVSNLTGEQAELEIWIDWNGDGDFDDPNEFVADLSDDTTGDFGLNGYIPITVPSDAMLGQDLGVRARLSTEDDMTPYGRVDSGEVEDYLIRLDCEGGGCVTINATINSN